MDQSEVLHVLAPHLRSSVKFAVKGCGFRVRVEGMGFRI